MTDINRYHSGSAGDDGDRALDAALAAVDAKMLAAINTSLDLDAGMAQILRDVKESSQFWSLAETQQPDRNSCDETPQAGSNGPQAADPGRHIRLYGPDAADLIRDVNRSAATAATLYRHTRRAADVAALSEKAARQAESSAPGMTQPRYFPASIRFLFLYAFSAVIIAATSLLLSPPAHHVFNFSWSPVGAILPAIPAIAAFGFILLRVSRVKFTFGSALAQDARAAADRDADRRDRLIDAYLGLVKQLQPTEQWTAEQKLAMRPAVREHMKREDGILAQIRAPGQFRPPESAGDRDAAALVLALIDSRAACAALSQLLSDPGLMKAVQAVSDASAQALITLNNKPLGDQYRDLAREMGTSILDSFATARVAWELLDVPFSRAARIDLDLARANLWLKSAPETVHVFSEIQDTVAGIAQIVSQANTLSRELGAVRDLFTPPTWAETLSAIRHVGISNGIRTVIGGSRRCVPQELVGRGFRALRIISALSKELSEAIPKCSIHIPLYQLSAIQVDASGVDLSAAEFPDLDLLDGIIWTPETKWPPEAADGIWSRSRSIGPETYQVRGGTERDPLNLIGV